MKKSKRQLQYLTNKETKVGNEIICPICGTHFIKKQWQQAFCTNTCKNEYWNAKGDRHKDKNYYHNYNVKHPHRLERIGIYKDENGKFGHYDENGNFYTFEEESLEFGSCENPILGI